MLTEIRDRSSGWFAWIIAALIIIPMAFWGVQEYAGSGSDLTVAKVGDQKISQTEFQGRLNSEQQRMRQLMGDQVDNQLLTSDRFKQSVLQQMIDRAVLRQVADDQGYRFSDQQLAAEIKKSELFQVDGRFDQVAYDRYLASSTYSRSRYEEELRAAYRLNQVTEGYQESALVLADDVRALLAIQAEQRAFDLVTVKQSDFVSDAEPNEMEIAMYYAENKDQFMQAERVAVNYVQLRLDDLSSDIEIDEDELRAIYEQNAESFTSEETRATRHILLSTTAGEDEADQKARAEQLVLQLRDGADFAELAKSESSDPGSASAGGSLGLVARGQMVPEFEEATFSLQEGQISDPVKSQFGYHIIQVEKVHASEQQPFEAVRFDLLAEERERAATERLLEKVDVLKNLAYEQPDSLQPAADELGLAIQATDFFERDAGEGIAANSAVRAAAFSEEVLQQGNNSEPIEIANGEYIVLRKLEYKDVQAQPIGEVYAEIKASLIKQRAVDAAAARGAELLAQAQSNWSELAGEQAVDQSSDEADRTVDYSLNSYTYSLAEPIAGLRPEVLRAVSSMRLAGEEPLFDSIGDEQGNFHIIRLTAVTPGDVNQLSDQVKDSTRRLIAQRNGQSLVVSYLESLRAELQPQVNQELL